MLHFGRVKKLHGARVLRDIANEDCEEWLPESWNKTNKSAAKYGRHLKRAWNIARDVSVVHRHGFVFLISYFEYVVEPILHNAPWEIEYFRPVLDRAYEVLYTEQPKLWGSGCYDYDQKHTMLRPIMEAFGEPLTSTYEHSWVKHRYSVNNIEDSVDFYETLKAKIMVNYQRVLDRPKTEQMQRKLTRLAQLLLKDKMKYLTYLVDTPEKRHQVWAGCVVEAANLQGYRVY